MSEPNWSPHTRWHLNENPWMRVTDLKIDDKFAYIKFDCGCAIYLPASFLPPEFLGQQTLEAVVQ